MSKRVRHFAAAFCLLFAAAGCAQQVKQASVTAQSQKEAELGHGRGNFTVDQVPSHGYTTIFVKDEVVVDQSTNIRLVNTGNSVIFTPSTHFQAYRNGFLLKSGGSQVASYTGMTAHLPNCYSVSPVNPNYMTLYEVNWSGRAAYVYARSADVRIRYWAGGEPKPDELKPDELHPDSTARNPTREWIVKEGQTARINEVPLCKPLINFWPQPNLPTAAELGATTGFVVSIPFWATSSDHNMSAESPQN